ncbi:Hypothetical predicted protein, partial [Mytilus galloprovincialis]
ITNAYNAARSRGTWSASSYAMSNEQEYFAQGTSAWFNADHRNPHGNIMSSCNNHQCSSEMAERRHIYDKDRELYNILAWVYDSNQHELKNEQQTVENNPKFKERRDRHLATLSNQKLVNVYDKEYAEQLNFHRMVSLNFLFLVIYAVKDHRDPVPSEIIQKFKFNRGTRHSDESVRTFIAALRSLTEHYNYGDTLNAMLRDRLVVGIKSDRIQRRLLAEPNLTFEKALEIATAMETAEKNAQDIQASGTNGTFQKQINKVSKSYTRNNSGNSKQGDCYRCGGNHLAAECRFKDAKCHSCKKKGHIAKKCRNKSANGNLSENHREFKSRFKPRAHFMEQDESSESENEVYSVFHFGNKSNEAYKVQINVNECEIAMEIDTGASVSIMSEDTYKEYKSKFRIEPTSAKLRTYMGEQIPVIGRAIVNVNYKKESAKLPLLIVKRKGPNLLGRDWLNKLQLDWKDIFSVVGSDNQSSDLNVILEANKEVFKDELGTVKGMKAKIYVDESADKVEMELERLEKEGQIQQVEFSDWAAPIVPVVKENGSIRICGDYKVTVNAVSKLDNYPIPKTEDLYATLGGGQEYTKLDLNQAYQQN